MILWDEPTDVVEDVRFPVFILQTGEGVLGLLRAGCMSEKPGCQGEKGPQRVQLWQGRMSAPGLEGHGVSTRCVHT